MTVIRPNSISGVSSITGSGGDINLFRADGTAADVTVNNITSGIVTATIFVGNVTGSGANITDLPAANLTGTIADARFPSTLPAISGASLTNIPSVSDINNLINNVAMLGFKVAVNGSLAKYNLVDQVIDEFIDTSGVDLAASTNESISGGVVSGSARPTGGTITTYSGYIVHTFLTAGNTNFVVQPGTSGTVDALIVAGGGGGGSYGGGGAGGFRTKASQSVTAQTYTVTVGAGGAAGPNSGTSRFGLDGGDSSVFGVTSTGGGGGGGNSYTSPDNSGRDGGSGGGGGSDHSSVQVAGSGNTPSTSPSQGNNGGNGVTAHPRYAGGGGGGAGGTGVNGSAYDGGGGGAGAQNNYRTGSNQFYAGGGGGAGLDYGGSSDTGGQGGSGIGGNGGGQNNNSSNPTAPTANTGSGGGAYQNAGNTAGAAGIVVIRYADTQFAAAADLTLQSVDATASSAPSTADLIMLMENSAGTATLNTDIKGFISRDSGTTFTQGTLVDEGTWGTSTKRIVAFHNLDISAQPSGTSVCYKITTHNQSASKAQKIHAVSHGWK